MQKLQLPHQKPIRFANNILHCNEKNARVLVEFECLPTLAMMIEAAAQSSAALHSDVTMKEGFLLAMKDISLIQKPTKQQMEVELTLLHTLDEMFLIDFQVFEDDITLVKGKLTLKRVL